MNSCSGRSPTATRSTCVVALGKESAREGRTGYVRGRRVARLIHIDPQSDRRGSGATWARTTAGLCSERIAAAARELDQGRRCIGIIHADDDRELGRLRPVGCG